MEMIRTEPLPFSDYVIFYFVDIFGIDWIDFYYYILVGIGFFAIGGWVFAIRMYTNCSKDIDRAIEREHKK